MTTITKNHGVGDGSGRWLFEDFLLKDGRRGRFVVDYEPKWIDMKNEPEWPSRYRFDAHYEAVLWTESRLFTDDGPEIRITFQSKIRRQVLEAFQNDIDEVEVYERDYR